MITPAKDPAEIADYTWTPDLDPGDTIASFAASVTSGTGLLWSFSTCAAMAAVLQPWRCKAHTAS